MLIFAGFLLGAFALSPLWKDKRFKNLYLIILFLALVFITGWRSLSFYMDTKGYYAYYLNNSNANLWTLFTNVFTGEEKDPFYHFTGSLFAHIGINFRGFLVIISIVYYAGFFYVVKRFSKIPFISVIGLTALSYVFFTMTGVRQTIAMGITFFAFVKAYDRKLIQFLLLVLLAYLYHSSALIFVLTYVMINIKFGWTQIIVLVVALVIALLFPGAINTLVRELAWNEDLATYANTVTGLSWFGYVIQLAILIGCMLAVKSSYLRGKEGLAFINMLVLGLAFQSFVIRIDNIFRLSMYFSVYGVILLSNAVSQQKEVSKKDYIATYMVVVLALIAYMLYARAYSSFTMFGGI